MVVQRERTPYWEDYMCSVSLHFTHVRPPEWRYQIFLPDDVAIETHGTIHCEG